MHTTSDDSKQVEGIPSPVHLLLSHGHPTDSNNDEIKKKVNTRKGTSTVVVPTKGQAKRRITDSTTSLSDDSLLDDSEREPLPEENIAHDPFLHFSCDKRRLEHLLGVELPHMTPSLDSSTTERKTRISFEVDPFYDLVTSYPELLGEW